MRDSACSTSLQAVWLYVAYLLPRRHFARNIDATTAPVVFLAVNHVAVGCNVCSLIFASMHQVLEIHLRSFEPLMSIDYPPNGHGKLHNIVRGCYASTLHWGRLTIGPPYTTHVQFIVDGVRSFPVTLGRQRIGTMSATNALAMAPMGILKRPRFHGPALNLLPTKNTRIKMGVVKATNAAHAPMLKIAPIATSPPKMSKRQRIPMTLLNHTALTGVRV